MMTKSVFVTVALCVAAQAFAQNSNAQDAPGSRAAGMGGAFVAVADDASAVYWNPAGLASGPMFNLQLDLGSSELSPGSPADRDAAGARRTTRFVAFGTPPFGVSYYRFATLRAIAPSPAVPDGNGREEEGLPSVRLTTSVFGVTLLQSIGAGLTLGTTLKLVNGSYAGGNVAGGNWTDVWDRVNDLDADGRTRADLDVGVMFNPGGQLKLGLVARNVRRPSFAPDDAGEVLEDAARLDREVRFGAAWGSRWPGITPLIVSFDADLTRVTDIDGTERRDVAAGAETWWWERRIGLRGGWRASTVDEARPVATGGISIAVRSGVYVDAHIARGRGDRGAWSVGGRFTY